MKDINKLNKKQVEKIFDEIYKIQKNICELVIKKFKELNPEFKDLNVKFEKDFVIERYYKSFLMHINISDKEIFCTKLFNACFDNNYKYVVSPILEENKDYQREYFIFLVLNALNQLKMFNEMEKELCDLIYIKYKVLIADPEFCNDFINKFIDKYTLMELRDYINPNLVDKVREIYHLFNKGGIKMGGSTFVPNENIKDFNGESCSWCVNEEQCIYNKKDMEYTREAIKNILYCTRAYCSGNVKCDYYIKDDNKYNQYHYGEIDKKEEY